MIRNKVLHLFISATYYFAVDICCIAKYPVTFFPNANIFLLTFQAFYKILIKVRPKMWHLRAYRTCKYVELVNDVRCVLFKYLPHTHRKSLWWCVVYGLFVLNLLYISRMRNRWNWFKLYIGITHICRWVCFDCAKYAAIW